MSIVVLGITDGDDGGAALLVDGKLVAAVSEERLNRMKMSIGFPRLAAREVLRLAGVEPKDVDHVAMAAFAETYYPKAKPNKGWFQRATTMGRFRNEIAALLAKPLGRFPLAFKAYRVVKRLTMGRRRAGARRALEEIGVHAPASYHDHHRCHAIAAFDASGFEDAVSISLDGGGDGRCSHVWALGPGQEKLLNSLDSFHSIGNFYAYVTHLCGFRATIHEGKITGLSAQGRPVYQGMFRELIDYQDGQIVNKGRVFLNSALAKLQQLLPSDWEHKDLAASIQQHLEDVVSRYVGYWLEASGKTKICLSGGVFANVLMNQRISDLPGCDGIFVFPAMGDGGLAAGAALCQWRALRPDAKSTDSAMDHAYLGRAFSDEEIEEELKKAGLPYERHDDIEDTIARLLVEKRVVARFNGAMEYGPRALGNRTIMYRPDIPAINKWLNDRLNRTEFMPFAPACLAGQERKLFQWNEGSARAARYMTVTMDCTDWMKEHCSGVVHIDGTARPQVVDEETNPSFYRVIQRYHELTGVPVVINTSFNMHEEPIVCTPSDAVRAFRLGRLDNLAIGSFLVGQGPDDGSDVGESSETTPEMSLSRTEPGS